MSAIGCLLIVALGVQGDLKSDFIAASFATRDGGAAVELSYDIPHTSLAFLKAAEGFQAGFEIGLQVLDQEGNPLAGDVWRKAVSVGSYEATIARDSHAVGMVSMALPDGAIRGVFSVSDLSSARRANGKFRVETPTGGVLLRFLHRGRVHPTRAYGLHDTVAVVAEMLESPGDVDSLRFVVRTGDRVIAEGLRPLVDSGGRKRAFFRVPVADSGKAARLDSGSHDIEVSAVGGDVQASARAGFRVRVPFFYDDDAYAEKVDELLHVATSQEMNQLRGLPPREREEAWHEFWDRRDPTPTTERNEREEEYFERIEYAKENFARGDKGYRSDRAQVYVRFGPPDNIESRPFEIDRRAYEIWYYYGAGYEFVFVDRSGFGVYVRESPTTLDEL